MGRRSGFTGIITAIARESARQSRAAEAARKRAQRERNASAAQAARAQAAREREVNRAHAQDKRARAQAEKEEKAAYLEARIAEVEALNDDLSNRVEDLKSTLTHTLSVDDTISFDSLLITEDHPPFQPPAELKKTIRQPSLEPLISAIEKPTGIKSLIPGAKAKYDREVAEAEIRHQHAMDRWNAATKEQQEKLRALELEHDCSKASHEQKKEQRNAEVAEFQAAYDSGDPEAILGYCNMVLERSEYPEGFPQEFRLAYTPESKRLVIEYELPTFAVIPAVQEYGYVKSKDQITEKSAKVTDLKSAYQDLVAAVALRTVHEVLEADQGGFLEVVCFNGFVQTVDPATGKDIRPHLISVQTVRERFDEIDLSRVDMKACLRNLGAQVSPRPAEAQPVKPVVDFDMVDKRFVDQSDVLADLESRPNLMELDPFEFEHLIANLFEKMGLESKLTRSSSDGGVDCIAFDPRPVFGGKVVIQAKRYKNTVGVSAVRDLYGTMMNEGANRGILVTTSGYGPSAYDFSKDKPMELIDGGGLLYLLEQVGIQARIIMPDE